MVAPVAAPLSVRLLPTHNGVDERLADTNVGGWFTTMALVLVPMALPAQPATVAVIVYIPALPRARGFTLAVVNEPGLVIAVPPGLVQV